MRLGCILRLRTVAVTGKALVVRIDAEHDLPDWLEHSGDGSCDLADQELLRSLVFGDPLYWVESGLADCAIVQLSVLDYRWNDVAHQLLLQEEYSVVDVMDVARARIHGWLAVCGSMI